MLQGHHMLELLLLLELHMLVLPLLALPSLAFPLLASPLLELPTRMLATLVGTPTVSLLWLRCDSKACLLACNMSAIGVLAAPWQAFPWKKVAAHRMLRTQRRAMDSVPRVPRRRRQHHLP